MKLKKQILCIALCILLLTGIVSAQMQILSDLEGHWANETVLTLVNKGIINNYADGTFRPNDSINVDEFIKMTVVALGYTSLESGTDYWASTYIEKAEEIGLIIQGEFQEFRKNINRGEMARIAARALESQYEEEDLYAYTLIIKDYQDTPKQYHKYILNAYAQGIIGGYLDGSFQYSKNATRAEASAMVLRLIEKEKRVKPQVIALVNGEAISRKDYENMVKLYNIIYIVFPYGEEYEYQFKDEIEELALNNLIQEQLILQLALKNNLSVTDEAIEKETQGFLQEVQANPHIKQQIEAKDLSEDFFRSILEKSLMQEAYLNFYKENTDLTLADAGNFYEENIDKFMKEKVSAKHILIKDKELAVQLIDKIKNGEDFGQIATEYSDCPSKQRGGDLGYFSRDMMVKEFEEAAFALKIGEMTQIPVKTMYGYHIILLDDKILDGDSFEEIGQSILDDLIYSNYKEYIQNIIQDAEIYIFN